MTRGGSGLVRGAGAKGRAGDAEEEIHLPDKARRDVPPVAD
jgi:hypothetical protein